MFGIMMSKNGIYQMVVLDDYIPSKDNRTIFSHAHGKELWVIILEKAWAKLHGSYERIIGGIAFETTRDLTGAPGFSYNTNSKDLFTKIIDADKRDFLITAGIDMSDYENALKLRDLGLIAGHAYSLIRAEIVKDKSGKSVNLVQLRNPWGQFEWTGDWSDDSDCWTPNLRKKLDMEQAKDDGSFWMDFEQVKFYFSEIAINKYVKDYIFSTFKVKQLPNNHTLLEV